MREHGVGCLTHACVLADARSVLIASRRIPFSVLVFLAIGAAVGITFVLNGMLPSHGATAVRATAAAPALPAIASTAPAVTSTAPSERAPMAGDVSGLGVDPLPAVPAGTITVPSVHARPVRAHKAAAAKHSRVQRAHTRTKRTPRITRSSTSHARRHVDTVATGTPAEITWVGGDGKHWHPGEAVSESQFRTARPLSASAKATISAAIQSAAQQNGTPYVWGGNQPGAFDCSGIVQWAYAQAGVNIPRTTYSQWGALPHVKNPADLQPGDVVFFENLGHEALYIGNDFAIEAPHTGATVHGVPLSILSAKDGYVGAVRPLG